MKLRAISAGYILLNLAFATGCSDDGKDDGNNASGAAAGSSGASSGGSNSSSGSGSGSGSGGGSSGSGTGKGIGGKAMVGPLEPATGEPGVWEEVTAPDMDAEWFTGPGANGAGSIVADPVRQNEMYIAGRGGIWKSTDYGLTWTKLAPDPNPPGLAVGHVIAVAGTDPATLWVGNVDGDEHVFRSEDGGETFTLTGLIPEMPEAESLYSIEVDPNDYSHLITGLHEADGVVESMDSGDTWQFRNGAGWPTGGKSWFPYFINTGDPATTSKTWFAIAQDGASAIMTNDGGETWTIPQGIDGLEHPHGGTGFFQHEDSLFVAGIRGPEGDGVYRSTDLGANWSRVTDRGRGVVWGTPNNVYAMWGWACPGCGAAEGGPDYTTAAMPGAEWSMGTTPEGLDWGPNSVAVSSDGERYIMVGSMWGAGIWRYVEP